MRAEWGRWVMPLLSVIALRAAVGATAFKAFARLSVLVSVKAGIATVFIVVVLGFLLVTEIATPYRVNRGDSCNKHQSQYCFHIFLLYLNITAYINWLFIVSTVTSLCGNARVQNDLCVCGATPTSAQADRCHRWSNYCMSYYSLGCDKLQARYMWGLYKCWSLVVW